MKTSVLLAIAAIVAGCASAGPSDRELLVGNWQSIKDDRQANVRFNEDGSFSGVLMVDSGEQVTYDGRWSLEGQTLVWEYVNTSVPVADDQRIDNTTVVVLNSKELIIEEAGEQVTYQRGWY